MKRAPPTRSIASSNLNTRSARACPCEASVIRTASSAWNSSSGSGSSDFVPEARRYTHTTSRPLSPFTTTLKINAETRAHNQIVAFGPGDGIAEEIVRQADLEREAMVDRQGQGRDRIKPIIACGCQIRINIEGVI